MFSSIVQTTPETISLEIGTWAKGNIQKSKGFVNLMKCTDPLWPHKTTCFGIWRFTLWTGSCIITSTGIRWATNCSCFSFLSSSRKELFTNWQGNLSYSIWCQAFCHYLFGRKFIIKFDHKPLQHLFGEKRGIPAMASARAQCWALTLSAYDYKIHRKR